MSMAEEALTEIAYALAADPGHHQRTACGRGSTVASRWAGPTGLSLRF
jgi:hypothetical protein